MKDVENYIRDILKTRKIHFTLIDPDEQTPEEALEIATAAIEGGTDGIMIGGSTVNGDDVDNTCKILSENIAVPIIIFPGNTSSVSKYADAIFYMSYVNSTNPYWINGAQALAAPAVKASGMEILSMAYMVAEPGGTVGWDKVDVECWIFRLNSNPMDTPPLFLGEIQEFINLMTTFPTPRPAQYTHILAINSTLLFECYHFVLGAFNHLEDFFCGFGFHFVSSFFVRFRRERTCFTTRGTSCPSQHL